METIEFKRLDGTWHVQTSGGFMEHPQSEVFEAAYQAGKQQEKFFSIKIEEPAGCGCGSSGCEFC
jgi:hypothetical protein|tara:strand:+ start:239 stop:433 length:195 start_codon:yes stop_codon:yes gene_type:complete